ncbi:hypothetical protein LH23_14270 [Cedecea neteri]|uniref:Uncharacterized protein n=1 Tax=Cedecea neteri TaxID=158822 RepID=A0AAN0S5V5_9ENTR|nr:hypothetical protein [Cedecea neteri]AIR61775.1 hypothetical protein LH23_14270 [Cedecea neteri]
MNELNKIEITLTQKPGTRTDESQLLQILLAEVLDGDSLQLIIRGRAITKSFDIERKIQSLKDVLAIMDNDLVREQYETLLKEKEALDAIVENLK